MYERKAVAFVLMTGEFEIVRLPFACTPPLDPANVAFPPIVRSLSTVIASSGT